MVMPAHRAAVAGRQRLVHDPLDRAGAAAALGAAAEAAIDLACGARRPQRHHGSDREQVAGDLLTVGRQVEDADAEPREERKEASQRWAGSG